MHALYLILYAAAAVCFLISAFIPTVAPKVNLTSLGLLAWVLVPLIATART